MMHALPYMQHLSYLACGSCIDYRDPWPQVMEYASPRTRKLLQDYAAQHSQVHLLVRCCRQPSNSGMALDVLQVDHEV